MQNLCQQQSDIKKKMIETPKNSGFIDVWATYHLTMTGRKALSFFIKNFIAMFTNYFIHSLKIRKNERRN